MSPKLVLLRGSEAVAMYKGADGSVRLVFHLPGGFSFTKPTSVRLVTVTGSTGQLIIYGDFVEPQLTSGATSEGVLGIFPAVNNPAVPLHINSLPADLTVRLCPLGPHDLAEQVPALCILLAIK